MTLAVFLIAGVVGAALMFWTGAPGIGGTLLAVTAAFVCLWPGGSGMAARGDKDWGGNG